MKFKDKIKEISENRILILQIILIIISIIFVCRLFWIQIINGEEYRKMSSSKLLRNIKVEAPRGEIDDRNGVVLATNRLGYDVVMYKTSINNEMLNLTLLKVANILDKNNDKYVSNLPINLNGEFDFYTESEKIKFLLTYKFDENITAKEAISKLCEKYDIDTQRYTLAEILKILNFRYEIAINGYSYTTYVVLAKDVSYESMAHIEEIKSELNRDICFNYNQKSI